MINEERLTETFMQLVQIDSVSREEGRVAAVLRKKLEGLGAKIFEDQAGEEIGGECGNLIAKFDGNTGAAPLMLNAHMDTVEPGRGIRPKFPNGIFTSDGNTILGADDKSAVAILLEVLTILQEKGLPHGPLEVVLTIGEEAGLLGAKHLDMELVSARIGYALDTSDIQSIVTRAPAANRLELKVFGKSAHAGAVPEQGINAIWLAGKALSELTLGRIDSETTCNIGVIEGGKATNIIPDLVTLLGEVRSHDRGKLDTTTSHILETFQKVVDSYPASSGNGLPRFEAIIENDFPLTNIPEDHPIITLAQKAAANLGRTLKTRTTGGGADANIFFDRGIITGVIGTGMQDMHTVRESVSLNDLVRTAELVIEIIRLHCR